MKLTSTNEAIEISGGSSTGTFSIAMNGKAFKVLSDTLYQNKIGSVVREISCNAYDAHVMAGHPDKPFAVHLPDNFEPWFSVQDFGIGLSPDAIRNVFTVYFESTKDQSNDAIGAFGLGAKTPFSYTDQFTVTSVKDGVKYIYGAFISSNGVPDMQLMDQCETDEHNGVEIKMSVKSQDFMTFRNELKNQLRFFKIKPVVQNCRGFEFEKHDKDPMFENEDITIWDEFVYGAEISLVQGIVGYKMDFSMIKEKLSQNAQAVLKPLIEEGRRVRINFNIGEIGVTASREGVEYDAKTVANIEAKLVKVGKAFADFMRNKTDSFTSVWDKAEFVQNNNPFGNCRSMPDLFPAGTKFDGYGNVTFDLDDIKSKYSLSTSYRVRNVNKVRNTNLRSVSPGGNRTHFMIKDKCTFSNMRVTKFMNDNPFISQVYIFDSPSKDGGFVEDGAKVLQELQAAMGGCPHVSLMSAVDLPKTEREKVARRSTTAEWYSINEDGSFKREFTYVEDIEEECVYVMFSHGDCTEQNLMRKYCDLMAFNPDMPKLIGMREANLAKAKQNENLVHAETYFLKNIAEADYVDMRKQYRRMVMGNFLRSGLSIPAEVDKIVDDLINEAPNSPITKALAVNRRIIERSKKLSYTVNQLNAAARFFKWEDYDKLSNLAAKVNEGIRSEIRKLPVFDQYLQSHYSMRLIAGRDLVNCVKYIPH